MFKRTIRGLGVACLTLGGALGGACSDPLPIVRDTRIANEYPPGSPDAGLDTTDDVADAPDIAPDLGDPDVAEPDAEDIAETFTPPPCPYEPWDDGLIGGGVTRITFDPRVPDVAWAMSPTGLMRSVDGALTFEPRAAEAGLSALAFPADDLKRFIGLASEGLFESVDGGLTMNPLSLGGLRLTAVAASAALPTRIYVGTDGGGVLRSDSGGASFVTANQGIPYGQIFTIAASPDEPDVALIGLGYRNAANAIESRGAIMRTTDGGRRWDLVADDVFWGNQILFCPTEPNRVFAAVRRGILASDDGGVTFERIPFLQAKDVLDIGFVGGDCDKLWATVYRDAIYRIDLAEGTLSDPLRNGIAVELSRFQPQLAPHPTDPDILAIATAAGIFRTADGGASFTPIAGPATLNLRSLAGALDGSGEVLLGTGGAGLWRRDAATPWQRVTDFQRDVVFNIVSSAEDAGRVALGTTAGSFVAADGLDSLAVVPALRDNFTHGIWRDDLGDQIFAQQIGGVFRSTDNGATTTPMNEGLTAWSTPNGVFIDIRFILRDPDDPEALFAGTRGRGIAYRDATDGAWSLLDNSLSQDEVFQMYAVDGRIYARVTNKGIQQSADGGLSWQPFNTGLDSSNTSAFVHDPASNQLFVTVGGRLYVSPPYDPAAPAAARWRAVSPRCLPDDAGIGPITLVERTDGGRDLILAANGNRIWRLPLEALAP